MEECVFAKGDECVALTLKQCTRCAFRKTNEELVKGRQKAAKRISNLPQSSFYYIARKYYRQTGVKDK